MSPDPLDVAGHLPFGKGADIRQRKQKGQFHTQGLLLHEIEALRVALAADPRRRTFATATEFVAALVTRPPPFATTPPAVVRPHPTATIHAPPVESGRKQRVQQTTAESPNGVQRWLRKHRIAVGAAGVALVAGILVAMLVFRAFDRTPQKGPVGPQPSEIAAVSKATPQLPLNNERPPVESTDSPLRGKTAGEGRTIGGMNFRWCPPGTFMMGSPPREANRGDDEDQVSVTLTRGFWLGETEVTQGQWEALVAIKPWKGQTFVREGADYPAGYVSWQDAGDYCRQLTDQERRAKRLPADWSYRLPTEAEWEYACRAGTTTAYGFGDDAEVLSEFAWYDKNAWLLDQKYAHAVRQKKANSWGLYDMHGNVWEWCADGYAAKLAGGRDPVGPPSGSTRVLRGGSWRNFASGCRSAYRRHFVAASRYSFFGFRVVLSESPSRL